MWVFLPCGFFSVVRHRTNEGLLLVRCRERAALDYFVARAINPDTGARVPPYPMVDPTADYPFRTVVRERVWAEFLAEETRELQADNFKAGVEARRGHDRYVWALHRIWGVLAGAFHDQRPRLDRFVLARPEG